MGLPRDYKGQQCSLARALEVVGERWTLLIVRDAFYGLRRFRDFVDHLDIPRAVLTDRLNSLVEAEVLARVAGSGRREEYVLTDKGVSLWPVVRSLVAWGDDHYADSGPRRIFRHAEDGEEIDPTGRCTACGAMVPVEGTFVAPGPGLDPDTADSDRVTAALGHSHRLLEPLQA